MTSAERRVREAEQRIACQTAVAEGFEIAGHREAAEHAAQMLPILRVSLVLAEICVTVELASLGR